MRGLLESFIDRGSSSNRQFYSMLHLSPRFLKYLDAGAGGRKSSGELKEGNVCCFTGVSSTPSVSLLQYCLYDELAELEDEGHI